VEHLDLFGIVVDNDWGLEHTLSQVALVLTGEVNPPLHLRHKPALMSTFDQFPCCAMESDAALTQQASFAEDWHLHVCCCVLWLLPGT